MQPLSSDDLKIKKSGNVKNEAQFLNSTGGKPSGPADLFAFKLQSLAKTSSKVRDTSLHVEVAHVCDEIDDGMG